MGARAELVDAWADLVHGAACVGCGMPGRPWCRSCSAMLSGGLRSEELDIGATGVLGACMGEYDAWLREMVLSHKEHSAWSLAAPLGGLLAQATQAVAERGDWLSGSGCSLVLVPVPSRRSTVRARGHDPALRMTRSAAQHLRAAGIQAQALPLLRLRLRVQDSVGLSAGARSRNLQDAFAVQAQAQVALRRLGALRRIVVCDDVMTTGTTVREACSALELAGLPASGVVTVAAVR